MTYDELHEVLDDEHCKISVDDLWDMIYRMKCDCFTEIDKLPVDSRDAQWYYGEANGFQVVLDLLDHLEEV